MLGTDDPHRVDGINRMGATFGAMFASGIKAAKVAVALYDSYKLDDGEVTGLKA